ncbi:hypothetical protein O181_031357 [Austropuccinia psidii MF-1]|uniref:Uncharacterized protein n=1 Tax=Austropuccinia psidii MF-1 TaxID=1389203 RepID=A0A9Q3D0H4_9BASI|nr:hypothetical protein [Austropuccinia psidii MF-1]
MLSTRKRKPRPSKLPQTRPPTATSTPTTASLSPESLDASLPTPQVNLQVALEPSSQAIPTPTSVVFDQSQHVSNQPIQPPKSLIVISFITRNQSHNSTGQGSEILFYKPKLILNQSQPQQNQQQNHSYLTKCHRPPQEMDARWTFLFIEAAPINKFTVDELSFKSINKYLTPLDDNRITKIRCSKPLRWDQHTTLVSVLYKLNESKNSKNDDWLKLNLECHHWSKVMGFHLAIQNELVSTAFAAIYFPIAFNIGYEEIVKQNPSTQPDLVTLKALETLYLSVQAGYARDGFKFYPRTAQPLKKVGNSDQDFKLRIWSYWTEVICWQLIQAKSIYQVSISYALNRILASLQSAVRDEKINVEDLEKLMVDAIGAQIDRCRESVESIVNHALSEILHGTTLPLHNQSAPIHVFTLGSSSTTYGVLSNLVRYFVTRSTWRTPLENIPTPDGLAITVAENRPLHEGVILATKLNELILAHEQDRPHKLKPKSINPIKSFASFETFSDSKDWYLDSKHQKILEKYHGDDGRQLKFLPTPIKFQEEKITRRLNDLLDQIDADRKTNENLQDIKGDTLRPKVMIELTTDVGLRNCLMDDVNGGVLLLAADRVLPNGDAICKLGSALAAYTCYTRKYPVMILVRKDRIHACRDPNPSSDEKKKFVHPGLVSGMISNWKALFKTEFVDEVCKRVVVGGQAHDGLEVVKCEWISVFVTDSGCIDVGGIQEISRTLEDIHNLIWEDDELS